MNIEAAVRELYQVPLGQFVAERKRLAKELEKPDAKALLARRRPTISAWAVNQLWWHARDAFDKMMETAEQLRKGHAAADKPHREAIAKLRARAAAILEDAGHAASESVLRRVTTTLSAIAAAGGWEPSEPGALADDLDPPGFAAMGLALPSTPPEPTAPANAHHAKKSASDGTSSEAEERRKEHERKELERRRDTLDAQIEKARDHVDRIDEQLAKAREQVEHIEEQLAKAREHAEHVESQLAKARKDAADLQRERRELD